MFDLALLLLRITTGALLAGHGAQKLFGWFGGPGHQGTATWLATQGLEPGGLWARSAEAAEVGGGTLMALGLFNPLGSIGVLSSMSMATAKMHWGKPIWVTSGGAELPVTNIAIATALALTGPGKYSLDHALKTSLPRWTFLPGLALAAGGVALGILVSNRPQPATQPTTNTLTSDHTAPDAEQRAGEQVAFSI